MAIIKTKEKKKQDRSRVLVGAGRVVPPGRATRGVVGRRDGLWRSPMA